MMPSPEDITGKLDQLRNKKLPSVATTTSKIVRVPLKPRSMAFDPFFIGVWILVAGAIVAQFVLPVLLNV